MFQGHDSRSRVICQTDFLRPDTCLGSHLQTTCVHKGDARAKKCKFPCARCAGSPKRVCEVMMFQTRHAAACRVSTSRFFSGAVCTDLRTSLRYHHPAIADISTQQSSRYQHPAIGQKHAFRKKVIFTAIHPATYPNPAASNMLGFYCRLLT